MSIPDLIGWARTTSGDFTLTTVVGRTFGQYAVIAGDAWQPVAGDVFVDPNGLSDTVVSVDPGTPTEFTAVNEHAGWTDGFATITRKASAIPSVANFNGPAVAFDDPARQVTVLGLSAEYTIAHTFSTSGRLNPTGWAYASIIELTPGFDEVEIRSAMWFAPQGVKLLVNVHASQDIVIKHDNGTDIPEGLIFTLDGADLAFGPGETVALIRDTLGSNDRWRAVRSTRPPPPPP